MTWKGERRKQLPRDWALIRQRRLELDGYRCTAPEDGWVDEPEPRNLPPLRCRNRATDVDHPEDPHDHRLQSLRSLCSWHHKQKTQAEAQEAAAKARALKPGRNRPKAKHPGLR